MRVSDLFARSRTTTVPEVGLALPRGRHPTPTRTGLRTRNVPVAGYVAALLALPGLVVVGGMEAGAWSTTGVSAGALSGGASQGGGTGGSAPANPVAPADVKGSMSVQQVVDGFPSVTVDQVLAQLGAPLDTPASTQLKTIVEKGNGVDIPTLRTWLAEQAAR